MRTWPHHRIWYLGTLVSPYVGLVVGRDLSKHCTAGRCAKWNEDRQGPRTQGFPRILSPAAGEVAREDLPAEHLLHVNSSLATSGHSGAPGWSRRNRVVGKGQPSAPSLRPPVLFCKVGTHRKPSSDGLHEHCPKLCRGWAVPGTEQDQEHRAHCSQRHRVKSAGGGQESCAITT